MPAIPQPDDFAVQRDYMHDSGAFGASQAKVDEFVALHPIQRGQVVHQLAMEEVLRESALPLRNLDRASWRDLVTLADTLRQPAPTSPEAAVREAGVPVVADSEAPPDTGQDRQNREETLSFLREAGIPTTQHAPAQAESDLDFDSMSESSRAAWLQDQGVPMKEAGLSDQEAALSRRLDALERMIETGRPRPTSSLPDPLAAAFGHQEEQPEMTLAEAMAESGLPLKAAS
jgi:hypothetical protein